MFVRWLDSLIGRIFLVYIGYVSTLLSIMVFGGGVTNYDASGPDAPGVIVLGDPPPVVDTSGRVDDMEILAERNALLRALEISESTDNYRYYDSIAAHYANRDATLAFEQSSIAISNALRIAIEEELQRVAEQVEHTQYRETMSIVSQARARAKQLASPANLTVELEDRMRRGSEYAVSIAIQAQGEDGNALAIEEFAERSPAPTLFADTVQATDELRADILAADFEIVEGRVGWQSVVPETATVWMWRITPKSSGQKTITFVLDQRVRIRDEYAVVPVDNYPRDVVVEVTATQWIGDSTSWFVDRFWHYILGALGLIGGVAAIIQLWIWFGPRRRPSASGPAIVNDELPGSAGVSEEIAAATDSSPAGEQT